MTDATQSTHRLTQPRGPRINGRQCRSYVKKREPFRNSNGQLYAVWTAAGVAYADTPVGMRYVVYSYGEHWPLFIWDDLTQRWYANSEKYGTTTSRHHSQAHPHVDDVTHLSTYAMRVLATAGYPALATARLEGSTTHD